MQKAFSILAALVLIGIAGCRFSEPTDREARLKMEVVLANWNSGRPPHEYLALHPDMEFHDPADHPEKGKANKLVRFKIGRHHNNGPASYLFSVILTFNRDGREWREGRIYDVSYATGRWVVKGRKV